MPMFPDLVRVTSSPQSLIPKRNAMFYSVSSSFQSFPCSLAARSPRPWHCTRRAELKNGLRIHAEADDCLHWQTTRCLQLDRRAVRRCDYRRRPGAMLRRCARDSICAHAFANFDVDSSPQRRGCREFHLPCGLRGSRPSTTGFMQAAALGRRGIAISMRFAFTLRGFRLFRWPEARCPLCRGIHCRHCLKPLMTAQAFTHFWPRRPLPSLHYCLRQLKRSTRMMRASSARNGRLFSRVFCYLYGELSVSGGGFGQVYDFVAYD